MRAQCSKCGSLEFHLQIIKPKGKKPPVEGPNTHAGGFIAAYIMAFQERYGRPPKMFGPVVRTAQYLAKDLGAEAVTLMRHFLKMDDLWFVQNTHTLRIMQMSIEQIRESYFKTQPVDNSKYDLTAETQEP